MPRHVTTQPSYSHVCIQPISINVELVVRLEVKGVSTDIGNPLPLAHAHWVTTISDPVSGTGSTPWRPAGSFSLDGPGMVAQPSDNKH